MKTTVQSCNMTATFAPRCSQTPLAINIAIVQYNRITSNAWRMACWYRDRLLHSYMFPMFAKNKGTSEYNHTHSHVILIPPRHLTQPHLDLSVATIRPSESFNILLLFQINPESYCICLPFHLPVTQLFRS